VCISKRFYGRKTGGEILMMQQNIETPAEISSKLHNDKGDPTRNRSMSKTLIAMQQCTILTNPPF